MQTMSPGHTETYADPNTVPHGSHTAPGVVWPAVFGGATVITALSAALLMLGTGLGFAAVSPWGDHGVSAKTLGVAAIVWLIIMQWVASGVGGYLTGRWRVKWTGVHEHEVFFRDTANGFLAWSLATILTVTIVASALTSAAGTGAKMLTGVAAGGAAGAAQGASTKSTMTDPDAYFVDSLYRPASGTPANAASASDQDVRMETTRLLAKDLKDGDVPDSDKAYLAQLVSTRTGLSQGDAQNRVNDVLAQEKAAKQKAQQAADTARKTAAELAIFTFLSMLVGAFIASTAAAMGGHHRDTWHRYTDRMV